MASQSTGEFTRFSISLIAFCFLMNVVARGLSETFAVFLLPMASDTGWSRSQLSGIYATFMLAIGLSAPFLGNLFDRIGGRVVYTVGLVLYATGFVIASLSQELWQIYLGLGVFVGMGVAAIGMAPSTALISRWFHQRMSFAMGCTNAGMGAGILLMAPISHLLIEQFGWRTSYQIFAFGVIALVPLILLAPWKKIHAGPGGIDSTPKIRSLWLPKEIFKEKGFWGLGAVFFFTSFAIFLVNVQLVAFLTESGFDPFVAASAYGALSTASIIGVLYTGWLADLYGRLKVVTISYSLTISGIALIWMTGNNPVFAMLVPALILYGLAMGARGPIVSTLVARLFPNNVAGVFGTISVGMGLGAGTGSWLSGALFDLTGGYGAGFTAAFISACLGLSQFWLNPALSKS